jgi:putative aldouronate transport system substrate-binding protein
MMFKRKRITTMVPALLMISMTSCLDGNSDIATVSKETPVQVAPVTISTAKALRDYDTLKNNDTPEDNPITRWAKERLGIIQTNKWILTGQKDALETKVRIALSGDEELPDVMFLTNHEMPSLLEDLVGSGKIMNIEEAFANHASDRIKYAYEKNPDVWKTVSLNGKAWGLPQISDGKVGDPILWIRKDWLHKLNLKPPGTIDELEKIMDAFTNGDPDGNGVKDTIGLALAGKNGLNGWMGDASFIFGAYGDQPSQWNRLKDGKLAYGSLQPELKPGLAKLSDWYAKGYIHPDFGTHDEEKAAQLLTTSAAGIISGPGWMGGWPLGEMEKVNQASVFQPIPYPAGPGGKISRIGSRLSYGAYFFRTDFLHMDAIFKYYDQVYGSLIEDPASDFAIGYGEGYDYARKEEEVVYDFPGATSNLTNYFLIAPGSTPPHVMEGDPIEQRVFQGRIQTPYEKKLAATSSRLFLEGRIVGDEQLAYSQKNEFVGPYTPTMKLKWPLLQKLEKETFLKIIYGEAHPDYLDAFMQKWKEYDGEQITTEVNLWDQEASRR